MYTRVSFFPVSTTWHRIPYASLWRQVQKSKDVSLTSSHSPTFAIWWDILIYQVFIYIFIFHKTFHRYLYFEFYANAYLQLPIYEIFCDENTWGSVQYIFLPLGVLSAVWIFPCFISQVLQGISGAVSNLDDILLFSNSGAKNEKVFGAQSWAGIKINHKISIYFQKEVT